MLCYFSHLRSCKSIFDLSIPLASLSLFEVPSSEQSVILGLRAILGYKMEAPGKYESNQKKKKKWTLAELILGIKWWSPEYANPTQK